MTACQSGCSPNHLQQLQFPSSLSGTPVEAAFGPSWIGASPLHVGAKLATLPSSLGYRPYEAWARGHLCHGRFKPIGEDCDTPMHGCGSLAARALSGNTTDTRRLSMCHDRFKRLATLSCAGRGCGSLAARALSGNTTDTTAEHFRTSPVAMSGARNAPISSPSSDTSLVLPEVPATSNRASPLNSILRTGRKVEAAPPGTVFSEEAARFQYEQVLFVRSRQPSKRCASTGYATLPCLRANMENQHLDERSVGPQATYAMTASRSLRHSHGAGAAGAGVLLRNDADRSKRLTCRRRGPIAPSRGSS
jgi:hypothetical protein